MESRFEPVFVVLRYDAFQVGAPPQESVTIKEVVRSQDIAEAEVARLNSLNAEKDVRYWWKYARLFPEGESAGNRSD